MCYLFSMHIICRYAWRIIFIYLKKFIYLKFKSESDGPYLFSNMLRDSTIIVFWLQFVCLSAKCMQRPEISILFGLVPTCIGFLEYKVSIINFLYKIPHYMFFGIPYTIFPNTASDSLIINSLNYNEEKCLEIKFA